MFDTYRRTRGEEVFNELQRYGARKARARGVRTERDVERLVFEDRYVRVVFDTNVYISAFVIPGSLSDDAYRHARMGDVELLTSVAILTELASKLRKKFDWNEERIRAALKSMSRAADVVKTTPHLSIVRDATDNRILECAEKVDADLIVTGGPHLRRLRRFGRAGIVRVSTFLRVLGRAAPARE